MHYASSNVITEQQEITTPVAALVRAVINSLVNHTDSVNVDCMVDDDLVRIKVTVAAEDLNRVLGHQGRTIRSIRTVLQATFAKLHCRYEFVVQEHISTPRAIAVPHTP